MNTPGRPKNSHPLDAMCHALDQSYEELSFLHRLNDKMTLRHNKNDFFPWLCRELAGVLQVEIVLALRSALKSKGLAELIASEGSAQPLQGIIDLIWSRTVKESQRTGICLLIDAIKPGPARFVWPGGLRNILAAPIGPCQQPSAILVAVNKRSCNEFDAFDARLLQSVTADAAVYLENLNLYRDMHELLLGSLGALTRSIDAKDPYTHGHSERVAIIARWLAQKMNLNSEEIETIYLTGLLHDIGKIGVREAVLGKPGRLEHHEFDEIRRHPRIGADILGGIKQMAAVTPGVLSHHERFDGSGYPQGLSGRNIPLTGRTVQLADSFDAMISNRTYRCALPPDAALCEIRRFAGTQFDPDIADLLLTCDMNSLKDELRCVTQRVNVTPGTAVIMQN
ncbi:MAG: HD domain-containing protein [Sedimentisphaerales bacterium]|nr:HD domain-containing protein [Sedimentisphaerales bacterium]